MENKLRSYQIFAKCIHYKKFLNKLTGAYKNFRIENKNHSEHSPVTEKKCTYYNRYIYIL